MSAHATITIRVPAVWLRAAHALRQTWATQSELHRRQQIRNRPWEHDVLHWGVDEHGMPVLHGHLVPASASAPVTCAGWCPCRVGAR